MRPRAKRLALALCLLSVAVSAAFAQAARPEEELIKAQKANEEAQAEYYRLQAKKLAEPPKQKSLWEDVQNSPGSYLGGAAALVALISFFFNYRATLRSQKDTQFYEALKRFGDKDSPTIRASAAGLLAQIGRERRRFIFGRSPYAHTAIHQLVTGQLLEENSVVFGSIKDALLTLAASNRKWAAKQLYEANKQLQEDLVRAVARLASAAGAAGVSDMSAELWEHLESVTGYKREVLAELLARPDLRAAQYFEPPGPLDDADARAAEAEAAERELDLTCRRLRANVDVFSKVFGSFSGMPSFVTLYYTVYQHVYKKKLMSDLNRSIAQSFDNIFLVEAPLRYAEMTQAFFINAQLQGANMSRARLRGMELTRVRLQGADLSFSKLSVNLMGAKLQGANLHKANLRFTRLWAAEIDDRTDLTGVEWWRANFFYCEEGETEDRTRVDSRLLETLYERHGDDMPRGSWRLHRSVRQFLAEREKLREGAAAPGGGS